MSSAQAVDKSGRQFSKMHRLVALAYGAICHSLFTVAIVVMAIAVFSGMRIGFGKFHGLIAIGTNSMLLISFPIAHSWLLTRYGKRFLVRLAPLGIGNELSSTIFAIVSSIQLLAVFLLWSPSEIVWWESRGWIKVVLGVGSVSAWLLLAKAMLDAQLSLQTGYLGWGSIFRNRVPEYSQFSTCGMYAFLRQPIYLSFGLILWLSSTWTPDQLALAILWTFYCVIGSRLKEKRYLNYYGDAYRQYQKQVPFWLPIWPKKLST